MYWWGSRKRPSKRMKVEIAAMKKLFSATKPVSVKSEVDWDVDFYVTTFGLMLNTTDSPSRPCWLIEFQMTNAGKKKSKINPQDTYVLKIQYSENHPDSEPRVTIPSHNLRGVPHRFIDTEFLCLHGHSGRSQGWDPASSTAATFALWALQWIRAWQYWYKYDRWPDAY